MLYNYFEMSSSNKDKKLKIHELICSNLLLGFMSHERIIGVNLFPNKLRACNDSNKIIIIETKFGKPTKVRFSCTITSRGAQKAFQKSPLFLGIGFYVEIPEAERQVLRVEKLPA